MKKLILLAALLCGASQASMALDTQPLSSIAKTTAISNALVVSTHASKTKPVEWECYEVTLSCGLHGIECGELIDVITRVMEADAANCP